MLGEHKNYEMKMESTVKDREVERHRVENESHLIRPIVVNLDVM